ncbi:MAG: glycosyltransferase family 4 protein [Candidatus Diapherotrites archaeon]
MTTVLLYGQPYSKKVGGAEQFTRLLQKIIPDLVPLYSDSSHFPLLAEPLKAKEVAEKLGRELFQLNPHTVIYSGMYGWALPRTTSYRKIAICHGTYSSFARAAMPWSLDRIRTEFVYSYFEKKSFANADMVISNSTFTRDCLRADYGIESIPISLATDDQVFRKKKWKEKKKLGLPDMPIILFVGRPDHYKGFDIVEKLARMHPEWHFVSLTSPRAQSEVVDARDSVPFEELVEYYHACDAVLFPSRFESFGYVTIEALMAHKPIVTISFGIAREIVHPYCIVSPSPSLEDYSSSLIRALSLPKKASFSEIEKRFSLTRLQKDLQRVFSIEKKGAKSE